MLDPGVRLQRTGGFPHTDAQLCEKSAPSEHPEQDQTLLQAGRIERIQPRDGLDESRRAFAVERRRSEQPRAPDLSEMPHQPVKADPAQTEFHWDREDDGFAKNDVVTIRETKNLSQAIHRSKAYYRRMNAQGIALAFDALLCAALTERSLPRTLADEEFAGLWQCASTHSVDLLLAAFLRRADGIPVRVREEAAQRLGAAKLVQQLRHTELGVLLDGFGSTKVLLLKGAGLAYTVYPEPHLRPRLDVDLFVRHGDVDEAHRCLVGCGYVREPPAALADSERSYSRLGASGLHHHADLHWGVANPAPFANVLPFDEAWKSSIAVTALGPAARTLGHADALLLACVHRVAHHHDSPSLLWLWDIHLLANRLTASGWEALVRSAEDAGMRAVTSRGLELAREKFGTPVPADVVEQLTPLGPREPAARFIRELRLSEVAMTDLAAMRSWRARLTFFRDNLFPPLVHMRGTYPGFPTYLLPLAYLHRIVRGAPKWFRRPTGPGLERQRP